MHCGSVLGSVGDGTVVVSLVVVVVLIALVEVEVDEPPPEDAETPMQTAYPTPRHWQLDPTAGFQLAE